MNVTPKWWTTLLVARAAEGVVSAAAVRGTGLAALLLLGLACGGPTEPTDERTCTPPAIPGCARVQGRVVTHDSLPATDVSVTAESADTNLHPGAYFGSARTNPEGRFELKVLVQPGTAVPDTGRVRLIARRIPLPSGGAAPADTVVVRAPFASHGGVPDSVHVRLRLPSP